MAKRKGELQIANIICALLVMFIHISSEPILSLDKRSAYFAAIYFPWSLSQFVVFMFVFLSGVKHFIKNTEDFCALSFYKRQVPKILVPYLLWVGIYYIQDILSGTISFDLKMLLFYIYSGEYVGHFYFVILILQFYLLMPFFVRLFQRVKPQIMLLAALLISYVFGERLPDIIFSLTGGYCFRFADRVFTTYFFFFTLGAYVGMNYESAAAYLKRHKGLIYIFFALTAAFVTGIGYCSKLTGRIFVHYQSVMTVYRIAATLGVFTLSLGKIKSLMNIRVMQILDFSSYNIYLSHIFFMKIAEMFLLKYGIWEADKRFFIKLFVTYALTLGFCGAYTYLKRAERKK